jgi:hypothetical protein
VPAAGWAQIFLFASALEVLAPQKEDKVPGNVQVRSRSLFALQKIGEVLFPLVKPVKDRGGISKTLPTVEHGIDSFSIVSV